MKINIIRGQNQIGGSIIEISTEKTRLIFDVGKNLDEQDDPYVPPIDGLFFGKPLFKAVFVSHYHADHIGLLENVVNGIPVYLGEKAAGILSSANSYLGKKPLNVSDFLHDGVPVFVDDITVTPFLCDHSAHDAYMFLVEDGSEKILYTGDFRANGRKDFGSLLDRLPKVDKLIIEGTALSREDIDNIREEVLENIAVKALERYPGPAFVLMSPQNTDRLITMHNIALRTNRILLEDTYVASIARSAGTEVPSPETSNNVKVFTTDNKDGHYEILSSFSRGKISRQAISKENYIMCVRPSMQHYLDKLNELHSFENSILFYGMWKGYQDKEEMKRFLDHMKSKGIKIHTLHTSGHADRKTIEALIDKVSPTDTIPVHTENPQWFDKYNKHIE